MGMILIIFGLLLFPGISSQPSFSSELDQKLKPYITKFSLEPVSRLRVRNARLYKIGSELFSDPILSGNRNISCQDCHHPEKGTSDFLMLSLGQGSKNNSRSRAQFSGAILRRNSPHLINTGAKEQSRMFWDGRVSYFRGVFTTPEERFNGPNPSAKEITENLKSALSMQVIFPLLSHEEMSGKPGENEIANELDRLKAWALIVERIKKERKGMALSLENLFHTKKLNISHLALALEEFIRAKFQMTDTPYDLYLRGNQNAMSEKQKRGMLLFVEKARCAECHFGAHLSNFAFQNIGVPHVVRRNDHIPDYGVYELTKNENHKYLFKNPPLRGLKYTAPYMHNGAFQSLDEVVDHYNDVHRSLMRYQISSQRMSSYREPLKMIKNHQYMHEMISTLTKPFLRSGLDLTENEKKDLVEFLKNGLSP